MRTALLSASALVSVLAGAAAHADPQIGSATLPGARSGAVGDTLTVFAAITNSGDTDATECAPYLRTPYPGAYDFRAVAADNTSFSAPAGTPVGIAAGATQNFVLSLTASAPVTEREIEFTFDCANSDPAPVVAGVNTVLLTATAIAGPDILPILVTQNGDGIIAIQALGRAAAGAIAATNIGAGGDTPILVSVDMGGLLGEPLTLAICETSSDGRCVDSMGNPALTPPPPGQDEVIATIGSGASTFSVFAYADRDIGVPLYPDLSRVHVRFYDYAPPVAERTELASVTLAPRPASAGIERSATSAAASVPARPFTPPENLPAGIHEAVFTSSEARGEGLILIAPGGAFALWFEAEELVSPFDTAQAAFFGVAEPGAEQGRFVVPDGRAHVTGGGSLPEAYRFRGNWAPQAHVAGALEPLSGPDGDSYLVRGQYDGLYSRPVLASGLSGRHQFLVNGRPLGEVTFDGGTFSGARSDGNGGTAANCALSGSFSPADPGVPRNLFAVDVAASTASGEAECATAGTMSALGFQADVPRAGERGAITPDTLIAIGESDDETAAALLTFRPIGTDGISVTRLATGLSQALFLTGLPGSIDRALVVRQNGQVAVINTQTGEIDPDLFLDVGDDILAGGERGLLGLALAPDFAGSGVFYINLTNVTGDTEIRRYTTLPGDLTQADPASADIILTQAQPGTTHNGGWLGFGPDGYLYIALGDGGGPDPAIAQDTSSLLGSILRLDVSSDGFPGDPDRDYAIPAGNPFAGGGGAPEIWAAGLRNPFRASFDPLTGDLVIGDVGNAALEEIDVIPAGTGGLNFGWPVREGTQSLQGPDDPAFTGPVAEYAHGTGPRQGNSITGGYAYRGDIDALDGQYVFGDFVRGHIWSLPVEDFDPDAPIPAAGFMLRTDDFTPDAGTISNISSFGTDSDGRLYIVDYDGEIFRLDE